MELDQCFKQFEELSKRIAPIHAVFGPGGTWILHRERIKAELYSEWFDTLVTDSSTPKKTDVEQHVLRDPRWKEAIDEADSKREELYRLYGQRQVIRWTIEHRFYEQSELVEHERSEDSQGDFG